ncbi:MAG: hypothetical protein ACNS64_03985 [Candidatus Halalkalibacterium sp. M3_1C_030]
MMGKKLLLLLFTLAFSAGPALAQTYNDEANDDLESLKPGTTNFLMRGYSHAGFETIDGNSSFVSGAFAPIFLWQQGDRILFESEMEIEFEGDGVQFALEYANISYILNDYLVFRFGNFLTPFGAFNDRLHPAWINKMPNAPLGMGHDPVGPTSEFGAELRGGAPLGDTKINYSLYVSNGPLLEVHAEDPEEPPTTSISGLNFNDNNNNKAIGGRFGFLPFNNSALEVGVSGQYTSGIGERDTEFEDVAALSYAFDLSLVKNSISAVKGNIDLKAQWNFVDIDEFHIELPDGDEQTINQENDAYYVQLAYRPALSKNNFLSKLEFVGRYSGINLAEAGEHVEDEHEEDEEIDDHSKSFAKAKLFGVSSVLASPGEEEDVHAEGDRTQWAFGINYWITWRSALKFSYQVTDNEESVPGFFIHYALGF